jgi:hypothetical protein
MATMQTPHPDAARILSGLIPEATLAEARGVKVRALRDERRRREGPSYLVLNRQVFYPEPAIKSWLESIVRHPRRRP